MKKVKRESKTLILLAFAAIYLIWGTTYLAIKIGLEQMPPFLMAAIRYFIAGTLLVAWCAFQKKDVFNSNGLKNMLLGAFMLTLGQGVLVWVEQYLSSGLTAVYIACLPVVYIIIDRRNWNAYLSSKLAISGVLLGLAGIIVLFRGHTNAGAGVPTQQVVIATAVVLGSCFCWAIGSLYYKYHFSEGSLFGNVGWQLLGGGLTCLLIALLSGEHHEILLREITVRSWMAILYLAVAGSIVAFTASYYLLEVRPPAVVGTYAYVNPVIAVILGCIIAGEVITASQIIGMVIILVAAYLSNQVKMKTT